MENNQIKKKKIKSSKPDPGPVFYEIKIEGQLDLQRSKWFEGMTLTYQEDDESGLACTLIAGLIIDQPALHGLLIKIRDMNLALISVRRSNPKKTLIEAVPIEPEISDHRDETGG